MAILKIDGVDMPTPSSYKIPDVDLDSEDTNRNELGILQRDRIRAEIYKVELEYKGITSSQLALIKSAIKPAQFQATIITEIGSVVKTMYAGNRNTEMVKYNDDVNNVRWNFSVNLIEY